LGSKLPFAAAAFLTLIIKLAIVVSGGNTAFAQNSHPYCASSKSDTDGDGWGWENQQSCIVANSSADAIRPQLSNCPREQVDTDGDGFGLHNGSRCIVLPTCRTSSSDPDGDGYGWREGR